MTKQQIKTILEDLYAVDGNLRQYERELEKIILTILEYKPEAEFDENFRLELRSRLLAEAERLKQSQPVYGEQFSVWGLFTRKYSYAGVLATILILVAAGWFANKQGVLNLAPTPGPQALSFQKTTLKENAFGSLLGQQDGQGVAQDLSGGFGRGGGSYQPGLTGGSASAPITAQEKDSVAGIGGGGGVAVSGNGGIIGMPYYVPEYKFIYKGGDFDLPGDKVEVLRRQTGAGGLVGLENMLDVLGMGLVNLSSFGNLKVQNMNLANEDNLGYSIGIDFQTASIGISENWPYWEKYLGQQTESLKASDIPSDDKLIAMADEFLDQHGVSKKNYGAPEVDTNFRLGIMAQTKSSIPDQSTARGSADAALYPYIPDAVQVIYPLQINGQTVYEEGGNKAGLYVNINIRAMRASGLWNLTSQNYDASSYAAQTDKKKIIEAAENGGSFWPKYQGEGTKIYEIELGTPQFGYSSRWNYQGGKSSQYLVPALIFPITKTPSDIQYYFQKNIVIPLAKEFFDQGTGIPIPLPMPLKTEPAEPQTAPDAG